MAKGWESKSVESQMESAKDKPARTADQRSEDEKKIQREVQSLQLSRKYILHQIESSTNERYTQSLQQALNELEQKLAKLDGHR
jgi:signal recognition particle GTPase